MLFNLFHLMEMDFFLPVPICSDLSFQQKNLKLGNYLKYFQSIWVP